MRIPGGPIEDLRLVQEIRKYPPLYDHRSRGGARDQGSKQRAWQAVATELDIQAVDAKNRWRNVRDRFVREKKRLLQDGEQVYRNKDPWPLLDEMAFLWDFTTHRTILDSEATSPTHPPETTEPAVSAAKKRKRVAEVRLQPILPRPSPEWVNVALDYESAPSSALLDAGDKIDIKQELGETSHKPSHVNRLLEQQDDDELEDSERLFCVSVAAAFKRFTPKMRALAKWRIQQVLYEVEFDEQ